MLGRNEADAAGFTASASWVWLFAELEAGLSGERFGVAWMEWIWFGALVGCWGIVGVLNGDGEILVIV